MGFLNKLFGKEEHELFAPITGKAVAITSVNDPTFAEKLLGDGIAIIPEANEVFAPSDGVVVLAFETGHAISYQTTFGAEILIHVGLETVNLKGEHFTLHVENGDTIKKGQKLITFDLESLKAKGYDTITPLVICNSNDFGKINTSIDKSVTNDDAVISIVK